MTLDLLATPVVAASDASVPASLSETTVTARAIVARTRGNTHGSITRLASPGDLGQLMKPFVFLDYGLLPPTDGEFFGIHPHSGIATLSVPLRGTIAFEDTTGQSGVVATGGLEWMRAGGGVWHDGRVPVEEPMEFFQLWVALPAAEENAPAESQNIHPDHVQQVGPARVLLGQHEGASSPVRAPAGMNFLHVKLRTGERWEYVPPAGHTVAWTAVYEGDVTAGEVAADETIAAGELVVFAESEAPLVFVAGTDTAFVLGSAIKHPHELVTGAYSVHTSVLALAMGQAEIRRIGGELRRTGRL